ncbi:MAG: O-antigen ligase family protein, partial [Pseudomonadota bacterium]
FLGLGVLLSFSRGAWASTIFSVGISTYLLFVSARSNSLRLKVAGLAVCTVAIAVALLIFALSFDAIANLMSVRGQFVQSYDTLERFAGARIAIDVILANPLGIGAYSFAEYHEAEPHNAYLYSFLIGGWLGGFAFIALIISTAVVAFRNTLMASPVRLFAIVLFSTFLALSLQSLVVDTDHWRQLYILAGCIWGIHAWLRGPGRETITTSPERSDSPKRPALFPSLNRRFARLSERARNAATVRNAMSSRRTKWRRKLGGLQRPRHLVRIRQITTLGTQQPDHTAPTEPARPAKKSAAPKHFASEMASPMPSHDTRTAMQQTPRSIGVTSDETSAPDTNPTNKTVNVSPSLPHRDTFGVRTPDELPPRPGFGRR